MAAIMQHSVQETSAARAFWQGLVSHGPLKRFIEWFFDWLAIVSIFLIIVCSIVIASALGDPVAFESAAGRAITAMAIILINAALEGSMLGCATAAKRTGHKGLYWMTGVLLGLIILTIGFAVFHVDSQWSQALLGLRCCVALIYACVAHMSGNTHQTTSQPVITPALQVAPVQQIDYQEIARQLLPLVITPIQQANGDIMQELQSGMQAQIERLSEQIVNLQAVQITASVDAAEETESDNTETQIVDIEDYRSEQQPCAKVTRKLTTRNATTDATKSTGSNSTAKQKAQRIVKRNPGISASELATKASISRQYARTILAEREG